MILLLCENCRRRFAVQDVPAQTCLVCPYCANEIIVPASKQAADLEAENEDNSPRSRQEHPRGSPACPQVAPGSGSLGNGRQFLGFLDDYNCDESPLAKQYKAEQNAWVAAILSLFSGVCLGQFYNGQMLKGVCILGLSVVVQFALVTLGENHLLMAATLALVLVGSSIDAFVSAVRLNHHVPEIPIGNRPGGRGDGQPVVAGDEPRESASRPPEGESAELGGTPAPAAHAAEGIGTPPPIKVSLRHLAHPEWGG
jgi:hypothetical protein